MAQLASRAGYHAAPARRGPQRHLPRDTCFLPRDSPTRLSGSEPARERMEEARPVDFLAVWGRFPNQQATATRSAAQMLAMVSSSNVETY